MYVVKVGNYYVREYQKKGDDIVILLSKVFIKNLTEINAKLIAKKLNGEMIKIDEEVTND